MQTALAPLVSGLAAELSGLVSELREGRADVGRLLGMIADRDARIIQLQEELRRERGRYERAAFGLYRKKD